jgi:hypothetical protein
METQRNEFPQFDAEIPLDNHRIKKFRDEVVLPTIDQMFGAGFVGSAIDQEYVRREKTTITPEGIIRYKILAAIDVDEMDGEEIPYVEIAIEEAREHLTEKLISLAKDKSLVVKDTSEKEDDGYVPEEELSDEELEDEFLDEVENTNAWQTTKYLFNTKDNQFYGVNRTYELQNYNSQLVWDLAELGEITPTRRHKILSRLEHQHTTSLTERDILNIRAALVALGGDPSITNPWSELS